MLYLIVGSCLYVGLKSFGGHWIKKWTFIVRVMYRKPRLPSAFLVFGGLLSKRNTTTFASDMEILLADQAYVGLGAIVGIDNSTFVARKQR